MMDGQPKLRWTLYIVIASVFIFVTLNEVGPLSSVIRRTVLVSLRSDTVPSRKYVVMFDGGSTGTRIHIFTFVNNTSSLLTLEDEYFEEVKPGLSNFAEEPWHAAVSVSSLLEKAKSVIPSESWGDTPVALKATAGLRLLPRQISDSILEEISKTLRSSPFVFQQNSVSILDGENEGLFAWFTVNFLLGRLNDAGRSVASLDLGGGSTQVTFLPTKFDTLVFSPKEYILNTRVQNRSISLYTHSYLGLGLMSARLAILRSTANRDSSKRVNTTSFTTCCLPPGMKAKWTLDQKQYTVSGSQKDLYAYKSCYSQAIYFLADHMDQPDELWKREIYALSYYYERAVDLAIVEGKGGISTVGAFADACRTACSQKMLPKWSLCLDCSYISALLQHGLGLNRNKEIMFVNKIDGIETSWSLGAAFSLLS